MKDKEFNEQKKRIKGLIKKWIRPLGLGWWELTYLYTRGVHNDEEPTTYRPFNGKNGAFTCIMQVTTDYYYKTATMEFFLETCMNYNDEQIERYFVHECMHIFLKSMSTKQKADEEELVATHLASAFIWVREDGGKGEKTLKKKPSKRG